MPSGYERTFSSSNAYLVAGGWIGVDLFFVLSGFLVSGLLFREYEKYRELRLGHFLIRRGFKIYPPFWLLIGATFMGRVIRHRKLPIRETVSELTFVQNYGPSLWGHTWSLAVEEHFYLLLAFGFFMLARRRSAQPFTVIPAVFISVALLLLTLRIFGSLGYDNKSHLFPTHLRLDSLFFGVFLSYLFHRDPNTFRSIAHRFRHLLLLTGMFFLSPAFFIPLETTRFIYTYGFTLIYVGSGCLLVAALGFNEPATCLSSAAYIGSHSYSIYLWHMSVAPWAASRLANHFSTNYNWFIYSITYLFGAIAFGVLMSILTEFPILRIRDHFFPSRGAALSTNPP